MTEDPAEFYSKGAEQFAKNQSMDKIPQNYVDLLDKFIELVPGKKVLDAGCGHGRDTQYFTENGLDAKGFDLAENMIKYAKRNMKGIYEVKDIENLDYPENHFHGIWCNTVLIFYPYEEMAEILSKLTKTLKPGGIIHLGLKTGNSKNYMREKYGSKVKQYLLTEEKAREITKDNNLEIIYSETTETQEKFNFHNILAKRKAVE